MPSKHFSRGAIVKRSELHFGQRIFLNKLSYTEHSYGTDSTLAELKGTYVNVLEFCDFDDRCIKIVHPVRGYEYTIHVADLTLKNPEEEFDERDECILNVVNGESAVFDINLLM
jgi:hypothetical protein